MTREELWRCLFCPSTSTFYRRDYLKQWLKTGCPFHQCRIEPIWLHDLADAVVPSYLGIPRSSRTFNINFKPSMGSAAGRAPTSTLNNQWAQLPAEHQRAEHARPLFPQIFRTRESRDVSSREHRKRERWCAGGNGEERTEPRFLIWNDKIA
jgi:hypothetical protein